MKQICRLAFTFLLFWPLPGWSMLGQVDTQKIPIDRLMTNLEQRLKAEPNDHELNYALARVHCSAYALQTETFDLRYIGVSGFEYFQEVLLPPWHIKTPADPAEELSARQHLTNAIALYQKAVSLNTNHIPSHLGLAWCLDESGATNAALAAYRKTLKLAWAKEKDKKALFGPRFTEETVGYMLPLLDRKRDADEIRELQGHRSVMMKKGRRITPILISLQQDRDITDLVDAKANVRFDLDGSGLDRRWGWITPQAAWLVFDHDGHGQITSGLQLMGNVTFWIFWENGYHALASLDHDDDGVLRGDELKGLALWHDANGNGVSEPGEVKPLADWGITALSCRYQSHSTGIPFNPVGVIFRDGSARPSYDWMAPECGASNAAFRSK